MLHSRTNIACSWIAFIFVVENMGKIRRNNVHIMADAFPVMDSYSRLDTKMNYYDCSPYPYLRCMQKIGMQRFSTRCHNDACDEKNEDEKVSFSDYLGQNKIQKSSQSNKESYVVKEVRTKQRALDVRVFRQFTCSVPQFLMEQSEKQTGVASMNEKEALDHLMKGYDEQGKWINHVSVHEPPVQYFAFSSSSDVVVGAVDAQIRNLSSLTRIPRNFGNEVTKDDIQEYECFEKAENLPPHIYLSNMKVACEKKRRGIGSKLLDAVNDYVQVSHGVECIILNVYNDNVGARAMYEKYGFEYLHENIEYSTMIKVVQ